MVLFKENKQGFSLVELSIVLVILGLLTGGILAGQNLIRAAELRNVSTEFQTYSTAIMTFRDKYLGLPGDLRNAADFWDGNASMTNCLTNAGAAGTDTCNGDSNGFIDNVGSTTVAYESYAIWKQLANAGLIEGSYTGISGDSDATPDSVISGSTTNTPSSKLGNAGWSIGDDAIIDGAVDMLGTPTSGNYMVIGSVATDDYTIGDALTPEEAWNIDTKMDDGQPGIGAVQANETWDTATDAADCETTATTAAEYALDQSAVNCVLVFKLGL